ncbi:hypothetical protein JP75_07950 [Devosia riboflavina]|uniref:Uncharacterized protein n=2 Tax=Devosia riboflavina TaxID=46914 RepID=A0A087M3L6_9HYPH|nr:hypothetical protein JP75_07950 [Devosia riboflavina]
MQIVAQVIDLRMDVRGLETKTERAISDIGALTSEVKTGLSAANKSTHAVEVDMAKLVERVNHLPSKGFIVGALLLSLTVIGALVIFQGNIARLVGAAPAVSSVTTR